MATAYWWALMGAGGLLVVVGPSIVRQNGGRITGPFLSQKRAIAVIALEALGGGVLCVSMAHLIPLTAVSSVLTIMGAAFGAVFFATIVSVAALDIAGRIASRKD